MDLRSKDAIESSKQHDIQMGNKLIAEFMGLETPFNEISDATLYRYKGIDEKGEYQFDVELHEMRYHLSWDWLMPVVQKIEQDCEGVPQEMLNISLYSDINEVYQAVVEFIKNQNN